MTYRHLFPIYSTHPDLVYLDSGATTLKLASAIDAEMRYYREYSANIHRGYYPLSLQATSAYDHARETIAQYIGASTAREVIITRGATESLNMLASSLSKSLYPGDEVVCTILEHHSNFVPWQQIAIRGQLAFTVLTELTLDRMSDYVSSRTRILTLPLMSNVTGEILPVSQIVAAARQINPSIIVIVDAAQAIAHMPIDVQQLDCDYLVFSGHKAYGPTGVGILYGKLARLEELPPYQYGGDMIHSVRVEETTYADLPARLEAGTPPIAQVIGLAAALDSISAIGWSEIVSHETQLRDYAIDAIQRLSDSISIVRPAMGGAQGSSIVTLASRHAHPHDIADILGRFGICIRAGHHCAQPLHDYAGIPATARISLGIYNTREDIDRCVSRLSEIVREFEKN